jgi:hypothetical protein
LLQRTLSMKWVKQRGVPRASVFGNGDGTRFRTISVEPRFMPVSLEARGVKDSVTALFQSAI